MAVPGPIQICILVSFFICPLISLNEVSDQIIPKFSIVEEQPIGTELEKLTNYLIKQTNDDKPGDLSIFETDQLITKVLVVENKTNQKIIIGKRLDREELCWDKRAISCEFDITFFFSISDLLITIRLEIIDINDNAPTFPRATDIVTIYEYPKYTGWTGDVRLEYFMQSRRKLKKEILVSPALDPDFEMNGKFMYTLEVDKSYKTKSGKPLFELDKSSTNITEGGQIVTIVTTGEVDKEEHSDYTLILHATDFGQPEQLTGSVTILVLIHDLNEHQPKFIKSLFTNYNLSETAPVGTLVLKLEATDLDPGMNGVLRYDITDRNYTNALDWFTLSSTGEVRVKERLDYDRVNAHRNFNFKVIAIDSSITKFEKTGTATVSIKIRDENDEKPSILVMKKKRKPPSDLFSLTEEDRNRYKSTNKLDQIIWENDYRPNYSLAYLKVSDLDFNGTDSVRCSINKTMPFQLDKLKVAYWQKRISLKKRPFNYYSLAVSLPAFDREIVKDFSVTVQCKDTGNNVNKATFNIFVLDDNDNAPEFDKKQYKFTVVENTTLPQKIGHVLARDADSGRNAKISYRLVGYGAENFHVSDRGAVVTQKIIDRERDDHFLLSLLAIDNALPDRTLTGTSTLSISVKDVNDWAPEFEDSSYKFSVVENQPMNTIVGQIHAFDRDLDSSSNPVSIRHKFKFSLVSMSNPRVLMRQFRISPMGQIQTNFRLDREKRSNYSMYAIVSDAMYLVKPKHRYSSSTIVMIKVLDQNDNAPSFVTKNFTMFKVNTHSKPGNVIGQIKAEDPDDSSNGMGNGRVKYWLHSCRRSYSDSSDSTSKNGKKCNKLFNLDAISGRLELGKYMNRNSKQFKQYYNALLRHHNSYQLTIGICDFGEPELCCKRSLIIIVRVTNLPVHSIQPASPVQGARQDNSNNDNNDSSSDTSNFMYLIIIVILIILLLFIIVLMLCILLRKYNPRLFRQYFHSTRNRKMVSRSNLTYNPNVTMDTRIDKTGSSLSPGFQGVSRMLPNQNDVFQNSMNYTDTGSVFLPCQPGFQPPGGINVASALQNSYPTNSTPYYQQVVTPPVHHNMRFTRTLDTTHDRFATFSPHPHIDPNLTSPRNFALQPVFFPSNSATSTTMHRYYYPSNHIHDQVPHIDVGHYSLQRPSYYRRSQSAHPKSTYSPRADAHFTPDNYTNISSNQKPSASLHSNDSNKLSSSAFELYPPSGGGGGNTMPVTFNRGNDSVTYYQSLQRPSRLPKESFV